MSTIPSSPSSYLSHYQMCFSVFAVNCQASYPPHPTIPLSPTPYDRLINSGWNSSFALSRRSDIISSRSLFPLSLCLSLFFSYYFLTPFFFPLSCSLCHVSPELLFFSRQRIGESRGKLLREGGLSRGSRAGFSLLFFLGPSRSEARERVPTAINYPSTSICF